MFKKCKVKNCDNKQKYLVKGYCSKHYHQMKKYGKILNRCSSDKNKIINYKNYCKICLYNRQNQEIKKTKIDLDDINKIKNYKWCFDNNYAGTKINNKTIRLHQLILGKKQGYEIDHKNHDTFDNRKQNLRFATKSQNGMNKKITKNNISGYVGVFWINREQRWTARIIINQKYIHLGLFNNKQDAINSRKQAEKKYFGEFAYQKNLL